MNNERQYLTNYSVISAILPNSLPIYELVVILKDSLHFGRSSVNKSMTISPRVVSRSTAIIPDASSSVTLYGAWQPI